MTNRRLTLFTAVLAVALAAGGCKKKPDIAKGADDKSEPTGTTEGMKPPGSAAGEDEDAKVSEVALDQGPLKDIYFDFDQYVIRSDQRPTLEANGRWLIANPSWNVIVEGHCDERGTEEYNLALGDRRAHAARDYLQTLGVAPSRLKTISYGKAYPVDPRHDEAAWAKNRRAHFTTVAPKVGEAGVGR